MELELLEVQEVVFLEGPLGLVEPPGQEGLKFQAAELQGLVEPADWVLPEPVGEKESPGGKLAAFPEVLAARGLEWIRAWEPEWDRAWEPEWDQAWEPEWARLR